MVFSKTFCVVIMIVGLVLAEPGVQNKSRFKFHPKPVRRQKRAIFTALLALLGVAVGGASLGASIAAGVDNCNGGSCAWGGEHSCHPDTKFSYGCGESGICWSQCDATNYARKEWCYREHKNNGQVWRCSRDEDCKEATQCHLAECWDACSIS